jgi:EAL and modified HD-GYP domain-containing signal transduction protein
MQHMNTDLFLGRQPIFDRRRNILAYELLYRDATDRCAARVSDEAAATAQVMGQAFGRLGVATVLGRCAGFINVDREMLMSRVLERLPRDRAVLELLETVVIDDAVVERCRTLKRRGFRLALDDFTAYRECCQPLLEIADIVKVDILATDSAALAGLVQRLKLYPARLLAEKVETRDWAHRCLELGFDLFQGYYFARPATLMA